jgi:hypothetical protein
VAVAKKPKELPVDDAFAQGKVLANGRVVHDMHPFEVKKLRRSHGTTTSSSRWCRAIRRSSPPRKAVAR